MLINCVGPYGLYGEPVVEACIAAGTHYVDVSGEPAFMEGIQLKYNQAAEDKGVYIISACGFDSIPADLGSVYLEKKFVGQVNSLETYMEGWIEGGYKGGAIIHYGTWESAIRSLSQDDELQKLRAELNKTPLPTLKPYLIDRLVYIPIIQSHILTKIYIHSFVHKSPYMNKWSLPFIGPDRSVMLRSQRKFYETIEKRPVQIQTYIATRFVTIKSRRF